MSREYDEEWQILEKITISNIEKRGIYEEIQKKMENVKKLIGLWNAW